MKFFTIEWWCGCQTGDPGDAVQRYATHWESIRDRLPPELLVLHDQISLHDALLMSLNVVPQKGLAILKLKLAAGQTVELHYSGLSEFESLQTPARALMGPRGYGDLGYDEIDIVEGGPFEHRLLFCSSIELRFRFASLELRTSATH